jgi:hypothetical protein
LLPARSCVICERREGGPDAWGEVRGKAIYGSRSFGNFVLKPLFVDGLELIWRKVLVTRLGSRAVARTGLLVIPLSLRGIAFKPLDGIKQGLV